MENTAVPLEYAAYIPCYRNGNAVLAVLGNGNTVIIEKSIRFFIEKLLKERNLDIVSLRKNLSGSIGRANLIPIPLSLDIILIPVKVRKAIAINDGAYAYIVLSQIEKVSGGQQYAVIRLLCGYEINSLEVLNTVKRRISLAKAVREKFAACVIGEYGFKEGASAVGTEYSKPATKGDIAMLAYEMIKLRRAFERWGGEDDEGEKKEKR